MWKTVIFASRFKTQKVNIMLLHPNDNVGLALTKIKENCSFENVIAQENIPAGHKIALAEIQKGEAIRKYNQTIGFASQTIHAGDHVHTHNIEFHSFERLPEVGGVKNKINKPNKSANFQGYLRSNGKVGTRNYIGILSTVNCSASISQRIAGYFKSESDGESFNDNMAPFPNADGVIALTHDSGCGMSIEGDGLTLLQRVLTGYAEHPNFAGILIVGLGCEVNQVSALLEKFKLKDRQHIRTLVIQENGGTRKTIENGIKIVRKLLEGTKDFQRETVSAKHLCIGLECGGSDAYSGISANPALGAAADLVVEHGGSAIILGTLALPGNPYDGHTAEAVLKQLKRITGTQPEILIADRRYRGEKDYGKTPLLAPSRPSTADTEYKKRKQRKSFRKRAVA